MTNVCKGTGVNQVVNTKEVETVTDFFMAQCEKMNKFAYATGDFFYSWGFDSPESAAEHIEANFTEGEHYERDESFADEAAYVCVNRSTYLRLIETKLDCSPTTAAQNKKASNKLKEKGLEDELERWLIKNGIAVERQVSTKNKHRLDLWIPGHMMLELKSGSVNGEDVCQAIDYYATYSRRLLLVGDKLTTGASRGIDGFNRAVKEESAITFVTWSGAKPILVTLLGIKGIVYR